MAETDQLYQHRVEALEQIERGRDNVLRARFYRSGELIPPSSGTVSVFDVVGTTVVDAAAVTCQSGEAQYTLTGSTTDDLDYGPGWRIEWTLVFPDGTTRYPRRNAALVKTRLLPPATLQDLYRRVATLDPANPNKIHDKTPDELDGYLFEAWLDVEGRLVKAGRQPWLVLSPQDLRLPHLFGALTMIFEELATLGNAEWGKLAEQYRVRYEAAWSDLQATFASSDAVPEDTRTVSLSVPIFLSGGRSSAWRPL